MINGLLSEEMLNNPETKKMIINFIKSNGIPKKINDSVKDFHIKTAEDNDVNTERLSFKTKYKEEIIERNGKKGKVKRVYIQTLIDDKVISEKMLPEIINELLELMTLV